MYTPETTTTTPRARSSKSECCAEVACEYGLRNNYFDGKRLTTDSFRVEQRYLLERRYLLNRAIHGWGVVYGYLIISPPKGGSKIIKPGLALDQCGRELVQVEEKPIELDDLLVIDGTRPLTEPTDRDRVFAEARQAEMREDRLHPRACWLLSVHYAERDEGHQDVTDHCSCQHREWDRTCETVRYSLRRVLWAECCNHFKCELHCLCGSERCCDEHVPTREESVASKDPVATKAEVHRPQPGNPARRGGCRCLCDYLTSQSFDEHGQLTEVDDPCGTLRVDLRHGVPLARVEVVGDGCGGWELGGVDVCGPRRLVKRNDLLFDLIRGCDLTRISDFGWSPWHRRDQAVDFDEFSAAWGKPDPQDDRRYITDRFWIRFSRPVRGNSLTPDCFAITVVIDEREGWLRTLRVPILGIATNPDPAGYVSEARIIVDGPWVRDGVRDKDWTVFRGDETLVEVEVRGDFIVDCNGQTVDANAVGLSPFPTGNGTPGGTFLSCFRVAAAPFLDRRAPRGRAERKGASS